MKLTALFFCGAALWVMPAHAASLRCNEAIVTDGATQHEVLAKCGDPSSRTTRTEWMGFVYGHYTWTQRVIDEWTYDWGSSRLVQTVVFHNGRLVDVISGGYGTGG